MELVLKSILGVQISSHRFIMDCVTFPVCISPDEVGPSKPKLNIYGRLLCDRYCNNYWIGLMSEEKSGICRNLRQLISNMMDDTSPQITKPVK